MNASISQSVAICNQPINNKVSVVVGLGFIPGMCISTSLRVNNTYVILASAPDNVYKARRTITADWDKVYEIARICGLRKLYPYGTCTK